MSGPVTPSAKAAPQHPMGMSPVSVSSSKRRTLSWKEQEEYQKLTKSLAVLTAKRDTQQAKVCAWMGAVLGTSVQGEWAEQEDYQMLINSPAVLTAKRNFQQAKVQVCGGEGAD